MPQTSNISWLHQSLFMLLILMFLILSFFYLILNSFFTKKKDFKMKFNFKYLI